MADAALDVLGLGAYASGSETSEKDEDSPATAPPSKAVPSSSLTPAPKSSPSLILPSAVDLDLPDEIQWNARREANEPEYDRPGTTYNAVPLPKALSNDAVRHNRLSAQAVAASGSRQPAGAQPTGPQSRHVQYPQASVVSRSSGQLVPPQLRRPNVATEDLESMRTAKRIKPQSAGDTCEAT